MSLINSIGSLFNKFATGWRFGTPTKTISLKDNAIVEIEIFGQEDVFYDYEFPKVSGIIALQSWSNSNFIPLTRNITINGVTQDLSVNRSWNVGIVNSLTTTGNSGASTLISNILNIPNYTLTGLGGEPSITGGTSTQYWRGDKTWQTLNTLAVSESTNLYFTEDRVRLTPLTGYTVGTDVALVAGDSILGAFQKVQGQINARGLSTANITAVGLTTSTLTLTRSAGNLTASVPTWNQNTTGSAATLTTSRTLTIGSTGKTFNGGADVTWTLGEIGAAATSHTHTLVSLTDVVITTPSNTQVLQYNGTNWINATVGMGGGTVTSVGLTTPTGLTTSGSPITTSGTLAISFTAGYSIPTTTKQTDWDTAFTNRITSLTTTGTTGAATLVSNVLNIPNYSTPIASSTVTGTSKLFSDTVQSVAANAVTTTAARTYGNQLNASGQMVVNVPWVDTVYSHPTFTAFTPTLTGANVIATLTTNTNGHVTALTTRVLTLVNIGATTVGNNLATLTNPNAITFLRLNADNTVTALDAASFRTAIGATGTGTVTSVTGTGTVSGLTLTGTVTSSGNLTLGGTLSVAASAITAGTFGTGNYIFPGLVSISGQSHQTAIVNKGNSGTGTVAFNWNDGNIQVVTLNGNCTFSFSNPRVTSYQIIITQDTQGSRTVTFPTVHWENKNAPTLTGTANSVDVITLTYDGTKYLGAMTKNHGI